MFFFKQGSFEDYDIFEVFVFWVLVQVFVIVTNLFEVFGGIQFGHLLRKKGGEEGTFVGWVSFQGFLEKIKCKRIQTFALVPLRQDKVESGALFLI